MGYLATTPQTFTEDAANLVVLRKEELGADALTSHPRVRFQFTGLGGGSVTFAVLGPADTWTTISSAHVEDDVVESTDRVKAFRFTFVGTTGSGKVTAQSFAGGF